MSCQFYVDKREAPPVVTNLSSYAHRVVDETVNVRLHLLLSRSTAITLRKVRSKEESVMGSFLPTLVGARQWYMSCKGSPASAEDMVNYGLRDVPVDIWPSNLWAESIRSKSEHYRLLGLNRLAERFLLKNPQKRQRGTSGDGGSAARETKPAGKTTCLLPPMLLLRPIFPVDPMLLECLIGSSLNSATPSSSFFFIRLRSPGKKFSSHTIPDDPDLPNFSDATKPWEIKVEFSTSKEDKNTWEDLVAEEDFVVEEMEEEEDTLMGIMNKSNAIIIRKTTRIEFNATIVKNPITFEEAVEKEEWRKAMKEEINSIEKNETWELMNLPKEKKAIGLKWVYKTKYNADGSIQKHKARLVAKGYSPSDWAGDLDDRKSTSGNIFSLGSSVISWSSKKQATTALSTSEAEYVATTSAACQAIWLRRLLKDLHQEQMEATELFCDNKATIAMTKNPTFHGRTKHIEIRYHFIRDLVASGAIAIKYCGTDEQVTDILTKLRAFSLQS
ncbi:Retrotransposon protein [Musa troglodytarum]|uniref:Retrotransposon protein n=1 Tax=Musa troglodytarum TaxID=320322 RepID=A0A9E7GH77_9LILI|nr:Retrotransposon protein [Musa troglodytarum]